MIFLLLFCCKKEEPPDDKDDTDIVQPEDAFCPHEQLIGTVGVTLEGSLELGARVFDKAHPWIGPPSASSAHCVFHEYQAQCKPCDSGQVCSFAGECVDEQRAVDDLSLIVTVDGIEHTLEPKDLGLIWEQFDQGSRFSFELLWADNHIETEEFTMFDDDLSVTVTAQGDYEHPGELDVSWSNPGSGGYVSTLIPINHHAGAPTFTSCQASASDEEFVVPAEMVDPLSVGTGLEFQSVQYGTYAAAFVDGGCIQFSVFRYRFPDVDFP
ncbi:MAG: hypothetical protein HN348_11430 [Proteobacteria bacterium]|nr:hypothetical protein [Pseudomonadota bacterium]